MINGNGWIEHQRLGKVIEVEYLGASVEAIMDDQNRYVIQRVISTDPSIFLDPRLKPGNPILHL